MSEHLDESQTCPACGTANGSSARFCLRCGSGLQLKPGVSRPPVGAPSPILKPGPRDHTSQRPGEPRQASLAITAAALAVVALAGWWLHGAARRAGSPALPEASASAAPSASQVQTTSVEPETTSPAANSANPPPVWPVAGPAKVLTTSTLSVNGQSIALDGIEGSEGPLAAQMEAFLQEQGGTVHCTAQSSGAYKCETSTGYDVAAAALVNGAARTAAGAPQAYVELEAQARKTNRGIWK